MAYTIDEVLLLNEVGHDATIEIAMSSNRGRFWVPSFPASLRWRVAIEWSSRDRSTLMCSAEVRDASSDARVAFGNVMSAEPEWDRSEVPLSRFKVTVTGTYTVHVYVDESLVSTLFVDVTDSASEA